LSWLDARKTGGVYVKRRVVPHGTPLWLFLAFVHTPQHAVDPEKIEANYAHGVLAIQMPKRAEARAKQIKVNVPKSLKAA